MTPELAAAIAALDDSRELGWLEAAAAISGLLGVVSVALGIHTAMRERAARRAVPR